MIVQAYTDLRVAIDGRVLTAFRLPLSPAAVARQVPSLEVGKFTYLISIAGAINYRRMEPAPETYTEPERWYAHITNGEEIIVCFWEQVWEDKTYVIGIWLKTVPVDWEYQNPPRDLERITFLWVSDEEPGAHVVDSIPDKVAEASLAALPYMGMPPWAWVVGGVGILGVVGVVVATRK